MQGLDHNDYAKAKIEATAQELLEEGIGSLCGHLALLLLLNIFDNLIGLLDVDGAVVVSVVGTEPALHVIKVSFVANVVVLGSQRELLVVPLLEARAVIRGWDFLFKEDLFLLDV